MKYIKLLQFDLRNGILKKTPLFLAPVLIAVIACLDLANKISVMNRQGFHPVKFHASFANYIGFLYGGMAEYIPSPNNPFLFPVRWLLILLLILFITLNYPYDDMQSLGQQILIRTKGRALWWLSKCGWNLCCSLLFHLMIYAVVLVFCLATKAGLTGGADVYLMNVVFTTSRETQVSAEGTLPFAVLLLPVAISIGINLLQMTLSLFLKPIFSFLAVAVLMLSSAYFMSPFLVGNYAMPIRYSFMHTKGVRTDVGIIVAVMLILVSLVAGLVRFQHYDILNRD